jgi:hypothetical protein
MNDYDLRFCKAGCGKKVLNRTGICQGCLPRSKCVDCGKVFRNGAITRARCGEHHAQHVRKNRGIAVSVTEAAFL